MGYRIPATYFYKEGGGEEFLEAAASKMNISMLEFPIPIFLNVTTIRANFAAWEVQGPANAMHIKEMHALLSAVARENAGGMLQEIALLGEGVEVDFGIWFENRYGRTSTYVVTLHGLALFNRNRRQEGGSGLRVDGWYISRADPLPHTSKTALDAFNGL